LRVVETGRADPWSLTWGNGIANGLQVASAQAQGNKSVIKGIGRWFPRSALTPCSIEKRVFGVPFAEVLQLFAERPERGHP